MELTLTQSLSRIVDLNAPEADKIELVARQRIYKKGQFLVHEGAVCRATYFVNSGSVRTYLIDNKGDEHIVQFAVEGWWISDLKSFTEQVPATFNVQAMEDTTVQELAFDTLENLYVEIPKLERAFRIMTQRAFIAFQQRIVQNISLTAGEKYERFVEKYPRIESRIPQKYIASYLGLTPEFLSKLKSRLRNEGE